MAGNVDRRERARERDGERVRERERREPPSPLGQLGHKRARAGERPPAHHLRRLSLDQLSLVTERERGQWRKRAETSAAKSRWTSMPWPASFLALISFLIKISSLTSFSNSNFFSNLSFFRRQFNFLTLISFLILIYFLTITYFRN